MNRSSSFLSNEQLKNTEKTQKYDNSRTKIVIDRHMKYFSEGKLEAILSDYAPAAVLFTADGPLRGVDEIRPLFIAQANCRHGIFRRVMRSSSMRNNRRRRRQRRPCTEHNR